VFRKLAEFVAAGNSLVLVRGNHDVDFYWAPAREAFVEALVDRAPEGHSRESLREQVEARVEFRHWFYYVEDLLYVEHGHQYDETCSYHHVLLPVSPRDPRRIAYSFSDILMRYVVHPTPGVGMTGHDDNSMGYYVQLALSMGFGGGARLGYRFFSAVHAMLRTWREHVSERAHELKHEQERVLHQFAERLRLSTDKLRTLASFWARPVTSGFWPILRSVFLDMLAAMTGSVLLLAMVLMFELLPPVYVAPLAVLLGLGIYVWMKASRVFDPATALRRGAARVAQLMPARFVVMGHTHAPVMEPIADGVTYINLGGWASDEVYAQGAVPPPPCTHLVIRHLEDGPRAELRRWVEGGPAVLHATPASAESGVHPRPDGNESERDRVA
jgi:predicted phosphodiesterase